MKIPSIRKSSVSEGLIFDGILESWEKIRTVIMEALDEDKDALIDLLPRNRCAYVLWGRFAEALLREIAGGIVPSERIYGLGTGFLEDSLAMPKNVIKEPELDKWNLYLGNCGYNTEKERAEATNISRIQVIELSTFSNKLK